MHPLLTRPRQLGLYLLAWLPFAGILVYLLHGGGLGLGEATALTVPLCLEYAFVCLAAWYPCRATPLEKSGFAKLLLTHLTAAVLLSTLWVRLIEELAIGFMRWPSFAGLEQRLERFIPLLWVTGILLYVLSVTFHYVLLAEQA